MAASGGRDSTALLHATVRAARPLGIAVLAMHVHHGLSEQADAWAAHVAAQCRRWRRDDHAVGFAMRRVAGAPARGDSVEAWARRERYAALRAMAREADASLVLLAHHRRDQAETVLLQLLRGAGPAGLAAMPRRVEREGIVWARPWLDVSREAVDAYLHRWRLRAVEDPSNADPRFARSRWREALWPRGARGASQGSRGIDEADAETFGSLEAGLLRAAVRARRAAAALEELASIDLAPACDAEGRLSLAGVAGLSPARLDNLLRRWLAERLGRGAPDALIDRLVAFCSSTSDPFLPRTWTVPHLDGRPHALRFHRGRFSVEPAIEALSSGAFEPGAGRMLSIDRPGEHLIAPWPGRLIVEPVHDGGVDAGRLLDCRARARTGGERFRLSAGGSARSLKKQYQACGVSPWARTGPLIYCADELVYVPGLGIDAAQRAADGCRQWSLRWQPEAAQAVPGDGARQAAE